MHDTFDPVSHRLGGLFVLVANYEVPVRMLKAAGRLARRPCQRVAIVTAGLAIPEAVTTTEASALAVTPWGINALIW